jgi:hypothetical protein
VKAVRKSGASHFSDAHQKAGAALIAVYALQCALGALVHFVKPKARTNAPKRPVQNYVHALLGLGVLAGAFAQVRSGYGTEWGAATGRSVPSWTNRAWWAWVVVSFNAHLAVA